MNQLATPRKVEIAARLERPSGETANVTVTFPDGTSTSTTATLTGTPLDHALKLVPGTNVVRFAVETPPAVRPTEPPPQGFRLVDVTVTDVAFQFFLTDSAP
ncbi:MAG: hypothetical protein H0U90_09785 [Actinobacteria bacterium]|nr:hypothetical protein [Actinomycetota bacterium]